MGVPADYFLGLCPHSLSLTHIIPGLGYHHSLPRSAPLLLARFQRVLKKPNHVSSLLHHYNNAPKLHHSHA